MKKKLLIMFIACLGISCVLLGTWQLKRLKWKQEIIKLLQEDKTPSLFNSSVANIGEFLYRSIKLQGRLHNDKEIHLYSNQQNAQGYLIYTPFELLSGEMILLNRGWVPAELKLAQNRPESLIKTPFIVEGRVYPIQKPRWMFFDNDVAKNIWLWLDIDTIKTYTQLELPAFYIMQQNQLADLSFPKIKKFTIKQVKNDHLAYAITWYSLAAISLLYMFLLTRKPKA